MMMSRRRKRQGGRRYTIGERRTEDRVRGKKNVDDNEEEEG